MTVSDLNHLNDDYTYISDDGLKLSWVDRVLTTTSLLFVTFYFFSFSLCLFLLFLLHED